MKYFFQELDTNYLMKIGSWDFDCDFRFKNDDDYLLFRNKSLNQFTIISWRSMTWERVRHLM